MKGKLLIIACASLILNFQLSIFNSAWAQRPCRDTTVHFSDSVCQGTPYYWAGRELTYTGVFYDTLTRAHDTCDSVSILHLFVLEPIDPRIYSSPICQGETGYSLITSYSSPFLRWSSSPPDPHFRLGPSPNRAYCNPSQPTVYKLYADYADTLTCPDSTSLTVNPLQPVQVSLTATPAAVDYDHPTVTLHDGSTGNRSTPYGGWAGRNWYINGEYINRWQPDISVDISDPYPDTLFITMIAFTPTCYDSAKAVIPFLKDLIAIPNIFRPDAEENNRFLPYIQNVGDYHLYIYNRMGRLVFETADPNEPWDGTREGTPLPQGTYNYRITYSHSYTPTEHRTRAGTVTLLR